MKKPLAVLVADAHCHPFNSFNTWDNDGQSSRVMATVSALRESLEMARAHGIPWWCLGDLLHTKQEISVHVVSPLLDLFNDFWDVPVRLLVGNHERPDHFSDVHNLQWLHAAVEPHDRLLVNDVQIESVGPLDVYWLPYRKDMTSSLLWVRDALGNCDPSRPRILLGHGAVDGSKADNGTVLSNPGLTQDKLHFPSFNVSFWGDIHKHQQIAPNAWYVGALLQQNHGERNNPAGYVVLYDDFSWERVGVKAPSHAYEGDSGGGVRTVGTDVVQYISPDPKAVAARKQDAVKAPRMDMDTTDLRSMIAAYAAANPIPAGYTPAQVVAAIEECRQ